MRDKLQRRDFFKMFPGLAVCGMGVLSVGQGKPAKAAKVAPAIFPSAYIVTQPAFQRYLRCEHCKDEFPLVTPGPGLGVTMADVRWDMATVLREPHVLRLFGKQCPCCTLDNPAYLLVDHVAELAITHELRLCPDEVVTFLDLATTEPHYVWRLPVSLCEAVKRCHLFHMRTLHRDALRCALIGKHLVFEPGLCRPERSQHA